MGIFFAALNGIGIGLLVAVLVGPVFFVLLQTSIRKGLVTGLLFALGIVSSDSLFFSLAYFGVSTLGPKADLKVILPVIGGLCLLIYGTFLLFKKFKIQEVKDINYKPSFVRTYAKGFLVNSISPSGLIYWLGIVSAFHTKFEGDNEKMFAFFLGTMFTVFGTDVLKVYFANKLRKVITEKILFYINRVAGALLICLGGYYTVRFIIMPLLKM